jgi:hypothetical protein
VHAANTLNLVVEIDGKPVFGGHSLRRGGAQYLARCGVDVWRIQALARHSSSAILVYLDGVHAESLGNIAAEASLGRSLQNVREELDGLRAQLLSQKQDLESALTAALPSSTSGIEIPLSVSEISPVRVEPSMPSSSQIACIKASPFVLSSRRTGKCHRRDIADPNKAVCGWEWTRHEGAILASSDKSGLGCTKCAAKTTLDDAASESSASSDQAALSPACSSGDE